MAETYSLALLGAKADSLPFAVSNVKVPDSSASAGSFARAAQLGTPMLCLHPDGSLGYYVVDAERSTFANPVLRRVHR
jgi:hypothetical protein